MSPTILPPLPPQPPHDDHYWRTMLLLYVGMVLFAVATIFVANAYPQNQSIYALFSGILGGFSGAFFTKIKS